MTDTDPRPQTAARAATPQDEGAMAALSPEAAACFDPTWSCPAPWLPRLPTLFWLLAATRPRRIGFVGDETHPALDACRRIAPLLGLAGCALAVFGHDADTGGMHGDAAPVTAPDALTALRQAPVDLLVLGRAAAAVEASPLAAWAAALTGPGILVLDAASARQPSWRDAIDDHPGLGIGDPVGLHVALPGTRAAMAPALAVALADPAAVAALCLRLQRLGERLAARAAAASAEQFAARLELTLADLAGRRDMEASQLAAVQDKAAALEAQLGAATDRLAVLEPALAVAREQAQSRLSRPEQARLAEAEAQLATLLASTSWRMTWPLRRAMAASPGMARTLRRSAKLAWWSATLQLPARYRARQAPQSLAVLPPAEPPPAPEPEPELPARLALARLAEADGRTAALAQQVAALSEQVGALTGGLELERERLDWALGATEGVTGLVESYHAERGTDAYRAAFAEREPLVSVCVGTMDRAELLTTRCIASLRAQTYHNLQIVVVGDNCTDETGARLAALHDDRIVFVNLPERGPYPPPGRDRWRVAGSTAVNHAMSLCEGAFVTHLDDDDAMMPQRIALLVAAAQQHEADFLWHPFWTETPAGGWERRGNGRFEVNQVTTGSIFYHRYFARFPWDLHAYRLHEPGDWNRLRKIKLLRPRLHYVDEPLLFHHRESAQAPFVARPGERFLQ
jgi:hypothetical protein